MSKSITSPAGFVWHIYPDNAPDFACPNDLAANAITTVDDIASRYHAEAVKRGWTPDADAHQSLHLDAAFSRAVFVRVASDGTQERLRIGISRYYAVPKTPGYIVADGYQVFLEYNGDKGYTHFADDVAGIHDPAKAFDRLEYWAVIRYQVNCKVHQKTDDTMAMLNSTSTEMPFSVTSNDGFRWHSDPELRPHVEYRWAKDVTAMRFVDECAPQYFIEAIRQGWQFAGVVERTLTAEAASFRTSFTRGNGEKLVVSISKLYQIPGNPRYTIVDAHRVYLEYNGVKVFTHFANVNYETMRSAMAFEMLEFGIKNG